MTVYESGQRVTLLDYENRAVGAATVVDGARFGLDPEHWTRVEIIEGGEHRCENWETRRVRPRR